MLSARGQANADQLSIPWRFAKGTTYDPGTNPKGLISFATAENALVQNELENFAGEVHIPGNAFRYAYCTDGGPRLPSAIAAHINEYFRPHVPVTRYDIKVTAAATALHHALAYSLCAPGEAILTTKPYYGCFVLDFGNEAGVHLVAAETDHERCFDDNVVDVLGQKLKEGQASGINIRVLLIVNPHNPLGRCYPKSTLLALLHFCASHSLHLFSDEIYALSVHPSATTLFTSLLSIDTSAIIDPNFVHVTYGLSKDFGAAGIKLGCLVTRNEELRKAVLAISRFHGSSGPSVAIATAMLEDRAWTRWFISTSQQRIHTAYQFVTSKLEELGVEYSKAEAGFFVYANLSKWLPPPDGEKSRLERECMLAQKLVDRGVFLHPGEEHGIREGWFRIVYTMDEKIVGEGMKRMGRVLKGLSW